MRLGRCDKDLLLLIFYLRGSKTAHLLSPFVTQRLDAKLVKKVVNGLEVSILPDEVRAVLPTVHLSDHVSNCPLLWGSLQEGDIISNLVFFNKNKHNIVSFKKKKKKTCLTKTEGFT